MLGLYVECGRNAVEQTCVMCKHICSGAYANNVECMHTSVSGHIVDCSEFKWGIYSNIVDSYLHMN